MRMRRAALALVLSLTGGCAYELEGRMEVVTPGGLRGVRRVAVARFTYSHDWTGQFRDIYREAGVVPPAGGKIDTVDATFLLEDALASRGYEGVGRLGLRPPQGEPLPPPRNLTEGLRSEGFQALLYAWGGSRCESLERCTARVTLALWSTMGGGLLWKGEAVASTLLAQGDEMKAALEEALSGLPRGPAVR